MKLQDTFVIEAPVEQVWTFLLDIPRVSGCVPGAEGVEEAEPNVYRGKLKARVGAVKAAFEGQAIIEEQVAPEKLSASFKAQDRALASAVTGTFTAQLRPVEAGTQLDYEMDVAIRGRLGTIGFTVVQQTAKKMSVEFINCISDALTGLGSK
jgi:carbon monoxide dehydrogenase subunit G